MSSVSDTFSKYRVDTNSDLSSCEFDFSKYSESDTKSSERSDSYKESSFKSDSRHTYTFEKYRDSSDYTLSDSDSSYNRNEIDKILHQTWKTKELKGNFKRWRQVWLDEFPEYTHKFYTDQDIRDIIKTHFPKYLKPFDNFHNQIERVDFFRYAILYLEGGIYADLDVIPLKDIDTLLKKDKIILGLEPYEHRRDLYNSQEVICNAFMISPKGDKFWLHLMDYIVNNYKNQNPVWTTGPMCITNFYKDHPEYFDNVLILESDYLYPLTNGCTNKHKHIKGHLLKHISSKCDIEKAYVVHFWENSWSYKSSENNTGSNVSGIITGAIALAVIIFILIFVYFHSIKTC